MAIQYDLNQPFGIKLALKWAFVFQQDDLATLLSMLSKHYGFAANTSCV